tara:strand:- start:195 stop:977 length:783 start_codon:yes stop_codon:yes gene_type:complete
VRVAELYRYPVKSFSSERCEELTINDGKVIGDRVLAFRFADRGAPHDWGWQRKSNFLSLSNTPGLSLLDVKFDDQLRQLMFKYDRELIVQGSIDSIAERITISKAIEKFAFTLEVNPLFDHPERTPLNLIGDGLQGLFYDSKNGGVTVYSNESLKAFQASMGSEIDGRRFRTNVVIDCADRWQELAWNGYVSIGNVDFKVVKPVARCLATHANPVTGDRDQDIMGGLTKANGYDVPVFAIRLEPLTSQSTIHIGDSVRVN